MANSENGVAFRRPYNMRREPDWIPKKWRRMFSPTTPRTGHVDSELFQLPAEIRLNIYRQVFKIAPRGHPGNYTTAVGYSLYAIQTLPLFQLSAVIREEALNECFRTCTLRIADPLESQVNDWCRLHQMITQLRNLNLSMENMRYYRQSIHVAIKNFTSLRNLTITYAEPQAGSYNWSPSRVLWTTFRCRVVVSQLTHLRSITVRGCNCSVAHGVARGYWAPGWRPYIHAKDALVQFRHLVAKQGREVHVELVHICKEHEGEVYEPEGN